jgi:hypothetical protein
MMLEPIAREVVSVITGSAESAHAVTGSMTAAIAVHSSHAKNFFFMNNTLITPSFSKIRVVL